GRIGNGTNIGYQRLNVRLTESVAPGRHERRLVERGTAMANNGSEVGIADFVQRIALGERMRLDFEIVEVRHALDRRLGIVTAFAILIVELAAHGLLITQSDLFHCQRDLLSSFVSAKRG